jgi:hypothetical protein
VRISSVRSPWGGGWGYLDRERPERSRRASLYSTSAALSLSAAIAGWLFVIPTWGFSSLAGPPGLLAAVPGLWGPKRAIAILGLVLNGALTVFAVLWVQGSFG